MMTMPPHHHRAFVVIMLFIFTSVQLLFIAEVRVDSVMQAQCGRAMWVLLLVRFAVVMVETLVGLIGGVRFESHGWVHIISRLGFAIAMTVVLATLPASYGACSSALEQAATVTHSYALLFLAWLSAITDWIGFVGGVLAWRQLGTAPAAAMEWSQ